MMEKAFYISMFLSMICALMTIVYMITWFIETALFFFGGWIIFTVVSVIIGSIALFYLKKGKAIFITLFVLQLLHLGFLICGLYNLLTTPFM